MPGTHKQGRSNRAMTFFVCFLAALAGLLFGLDIGVIAGALPFISQDFQITARAGMGSQLDDVRRGGRCRRQWVAFIPFRTKI